MWVAIVSLVVWTADEEEYEAPRIDPRLKETWEDEDVEEEEEPPVSAVRSGLSTISVVLESCLRLTQRTMCGFSLAGRCDCFCERSIEASRTSKAHDCRISSQEEEEGT